MGTQLPLALSVGGATFLLGVIWGGPFVEILRRLRIGKQIRVELQDSHGHKVGTPTMGGIMIIVPAVLLTLALSLARIVQDGQGASVLLPLFVLLGFALLGLIDDWEGIQLSRGVHGEGLSGRIKFIAQLALATITAVTLSLYDGGYTFANTILIPLIPIAIPLSPVIFIPVTVFIIVGMSNAVNLTDGMDGLAGIICASAFAAYGIIASALVANFMMLAMMLVLTPYIARLIDVPKKWILAPIIVFCIIGAYSEANRFFDIWVMLGFAVVGFLMSRHRIPAGPFIIGFILTPIAEVNLRSGLMISDGSFRPLIDRPISAVFLVFAVITACWPFIQGYMARRRGARDDASKSIR